MVLTIKRGLDLLGHLKERYDSYYNSLSKEEKAETNDWREFVKRSVHVNNDHNGTEEDLIFTAEDAVEKMQPETNA